MNIKNLMMAATICLLSACSQPNAIEFNVNTPNLRAGTFIIKDEGRQTVFGQNIKDGKCTIKSLLEQPGFYQLDILKDGDRPHESFEVYLEPGKYTITQTGPLENYPKIESDSKKQQEITNYNALYNEVGGSYEQETARLNKEFEAKSHSLSMPAYKALLAKIDAAADKERNTKFNALEAYIKKYPDSELAAHFMARQNYAENPVKYLMLYQQLSPAAKNSFDGKEVAKALLASAKLQAGQKAPDIAGKTFDGKTFAEITAGKKLFLIDFWRSANSISRSNHDKVTEVYNQLRPKGFQVISVSMDNKPLWWSTAVKDDKLPWPQMSDLKGNDSPNALNWGITSIPTYYLVDGDWKIYKKDISLSNVSLEASQYLQKH